MILELRQKNIYILSICLLKVINMKVISNVYLKTLKNVYTYMCDSICKIGFPLGLRIFFIFREKNIAGRSTWIE